MVRIRSGFEWIGITLPSRECDDSCHDLELGAAMWGITTDAGPKQASLGDKRSDSESETGQGNMREGLSDLSAISACSSLSLVGFTTQPCGRFIDLKTHGFEYPFIYSYPEQEPMYGLLLLGDRVAALSGMSRNFGTHWATEKTRAIFHSIDSPYTINCSGPVDRACFSPALGPLFHFDLRWMATLGCGEVYPFAERPPRGQGSLKRLVEI
jgi:hypothetical protein